MTSHPSLDVPPKPSHRALRRCRFGMAAAGVATAVDCVAQTTASAAANGAVERSGFFQAFNRLDPVGVTLIVGAVVIVVLLVLRIWMMARGERPMDVPVTKRRATPGDDESLERPTLSDPTDWGFDQNKRSAQARDAVTRPGPSIDLSATQWSTSEVHNAAEISRQPSDSMGKPPGMPDSPYRTAFNPYFKGEAPHPASREVVEVADTLLQAELLVQLGDPKQAMTLLSNHIRETEKPGPAVWLMLLNLYQATGRKSQYEALSAGFGTLFNASVPAWASSREVAARDIESYPQVMLKLHTHWGKPGIRPILEALLNDDRGGSRQGFSLRAYRDLLFLVEIVAELAKIDAEEVERDDIQRKLGRIV